MEYSYHFISVRDTKLGKHYHQAIDPSGPAGSLLRHSKPSPSPENPTLTEVCPLNRVRRRGRQSTYNVLI